MKVEIYSDVACPWCLIGKERFERALAAFPVPEGVEVVYRPYQLDPSAPVPGVPLRGYLERRFGPHLAAKMEPVAEAARAEGVTIDFDTALAANTLGAHRLMHLAEREHGSGVQREVAALLFEAHFARGRDIADPEVLADLAAEAGMDRARAMDYLASDEGMYAVRAGIEHARRLGISAVPTFVFEGRYAVQGAQPASVFLQALEAVARESGSGEQAGPADADCADGSCAA
jgi:predicted DsbA family dithiol-disulfide isomerase